MATITTVIDPTMERTIYCVEDEPELIRLLRLMLERHGYTVIGSNTLAEARENIQHVNPDLLLLDLHLTDATQMDVLAWIDEAISAKAIPIMFLTGDLTVRNRLDVLDTPNFKGVIAKPFSYQQLLSDIDAALM